MNRKPHKTMTREEYGLLTLEGWHEVCQNVDGFGGVGVRYLDDKPTKATRGTRIDPGWRASETDRRFARQEGFTDRETDREAKTLEQPVGAQE